MILYNTKRILLIWSICCYTGVAGIRDYYTKYCGLFQGSTCGEYRAFSLANITSAMLCGVLCSQHTECYTYFYSPDSGQCHGCEAPFLGRSEHLGVLAGSHYYARSTGGVSFMSCLKPWDYFSGVTFARMTTDWCFEYCNSYGYTLMGVQMDLCICEPGVRFPTENPEECNTSCPGNMHQWCGKSSPWRMAFYSMTSC